MKLISDKRPITKIMGSSTYIKTGFQPTSKKGRDSQLDYFLEFGDSWDENENDEFFLAF